MATDIGDLFKSMVWDTIVAAALRQLFVAVPLLGWGPFGVVIGWLASFFGNKLYALIRLSIEMEAIVLKNRAHQEAFRKAGLVLKIIAQDKGINSIEFKAARARHQKALAEFVRFAD